MQASRDERKNKEKQPVWDKGMSREVGRKIYQKSPRKIIFVFRE